MSRRRITSAVAGFVAAVALVLGSATAANAYTVEYPEGGKWVYGVRSGGIYGSAGQSYSEYFHNSRTHRSTACGAYGGCSGTSWISPGYWANSAYSPMASSGNKAYYDVI